MVSNIDSGCNPHNINSSSNWIRHNRGDCPICNGIRKDCRTSPAGLVFCRANINPVGFLHRGLDSNGFSMWAREADAEAYKQQSTEDRLERKRQQKLREKEKLKALRAIALTDEERDRNYRLILEQLTLTEDHKKQILDRGLPASELTYYRSIGSNRKLSPKVDKRTPGVNGYGSKLECASYGIIGFIRNHKGQILGAQIRYNRSNNKYVWLSKSNKPVKLLERGLPLSNFPVAMPIEDGVVALTEGTSFKPHLTSLLFKIPTIGAAGGQFTSSAPQLEEALKFYRAKEVRIYVDGGMLDNYSVMLANLNTARLVQSWGYAVKFGWWNQYTKADGDIDEISQEKIDSIEYINPSEFFSKTKQVDWVGEVKEDRLKAFKELPFHRSNVVRYSPDMVVKAEDDVRVDFPANKRLKTILKVYELGFKAVNDTSFMGSGKSISAGKLGAEDFGQDTTLMYLSSTYKDPSVPEIANNYEMLPPRHNGLVRDAEGKLVRVTDTTDGNIVYESNCHLADKFTKAYNNAIDSDIATTMFCSRCEFAAQCKESSGNGYGYKHQRKQALGHRQIRADINSLSAGDYSNTVLIIEEASKLELTKKLSNNINSTIGEARGLTVSLDDSYNAFLDQLQTRLNQPVDRYGEIFEHKAIALPNDIDAVIKSIDRTIDDYANDRETSVELVKHIVFFKKLFLVLTGKEAGTIIRHKNKLEIETLNQHHIDIIKSAKFVLCLDSTPDWLSLNLLFGNSILEIREEMPALANLEIVEVNVPGLKHKANLTNKDSLVMSRVQGTIEALHQRHSESPVIGLKSQGDDYYWYNHNRGTNAFKGESVLICYVMPKLNLTAARSYFVTLKGDLKGFREWYEMKMYAEVIQMVGRPRAQHKPDEEFLIYFLTEDTNLDAIARLYGCKYRYVDGLELTPVAGTKTQQTKLKILAAIEQLSAEGKKVTQKAIAEQAGMTQQAISKIGVSKNTTNYLLDFIVKSCIFNKPNSNPLAAMVSANEKNLQNYQSWINLLKPHSNLYSDWLSVPSKPDCSDLTDLAPYFDPETLSLSDLVQKQYDLINELLKMDCHFLVDMVETSLLYDRIDNIYKPHYRAVLLDIIDAFKNVIEEQKTFELEWKDSLINDSIEVKDSTKNNHEPERPSQERDSTQQPVPSSDATQEQDVQRNLLQEHKPQKISELISKLLGVSDVKELESMGVTQAWLQGFEDYCKSVSIEWCDLNLQVIEERHAIENAMGNFDNLWFEEHPELIEYSNPEPNQ